MSFGTNGVWVTVFKKGGFGFKGIFPCLTLEGGEVEVNLGARDFRFPLLYKAKVRASPSKHDIFTKRKLNINFFLLKYF